MVDYVLENLHYRLALAFVAIRGAECLFLITDVDEKQRTGPVHEERALLVEVLDVMVH